MISYSNGFARGMLSLALITAALAVIVAVSACGGSAPSDTAASAQGNETDRAFIAGMIPHHESAIAMAETAKDQGESVFVGSLADDIIGSQGHEIESMQEIDAELASAGIEVGDLGMSDSMMGMEGDMAALEAAQPFDREFIDMMIPHHQGAIQMARIELSDGQNTELKNLAQAIIDAQSREIEEMNAYREKELGGPSPAGGVPEEGDSMGAAGHEAKGHAEPLKGESMGSGSSSDGEGTMEPDTGGGLGPHE